MDRLQKVLAAAGVGSRRGCEEIIQEGRVEVDRKVVTELGTRVDPDHQEIRVDGSVIKIARREYYVVNKPAGVVSTNFDPSGRVRVVDLIGTSQRVFTVGRLDRASEGLMIVTNDGELAQKLTHPKFGCQKTYLIQVAGHPETEALVRLKKGIRLSDGFAKIHDFRVKKALKSSTLIEVILKEGRNREIRRLLASTGHKVLQLKRIAIGSIRLGELPLGAHRRLDAREIKRLREFSPGNAMPADNRPQADSQETAADPAAQPSQKNLSRKSRPETGARPASRPKKKPSSSGKRSGAKRTTVVREGTGANSGGRSFDRKQTGKARSSSTSKPNSSKNRSGKGNSRKNTRTIR